MKNVNLIEQGWYMFLASYWTEYTVTDLEYGKIIWEEFKTILTGEVFSFETHPDWAQKVKDADIEAFKTSDTIVTKLKAKKAELEDIYFNDSCSAANKLLILDVTTALQVDIDAEEISRGTLMAQWIIDHWAGISDDYATNIINKIRWNI